MFAIGLILVILAVIVVVYVMFATSGLEPMPIDWGVFTAELTPLQLFFLGAATIVVMAIGALMLSIGLKKQGEKRAEVKRLRQEVKKGQEAQPRDDAQDRSDVSGPTEPPDQKSTKGTSAAVSSKRNPGDSATTSGVSKRQGGPTGPVQSTRSPSTGSSSGGSSSDAGKPPPPPRH
ncbi:MAG: hypothetical protein WBG76_09595 [Ornithinimicrobium sp.]